MTDLRIYVYFFDVFFSEYTEARHRVICAIRCAVSKRPFASQDDIWYRREVQLLRPGTLVPSSTIVSRDASLLYKGFAGVIRWYFEVNLPLFRTAVGDKLF